MLHPAPLFKNSGAEQKTPQALGFKEVPLGSLCGCSRDRDELHASDGL